MSTLSISIDCPADQVYRFVSNPRNLPQWATAFCQSVKRSGNAWMVATPQGPVKFRFVGKNRLGVLDHYVSPEPGVEIYVPMRVVPRGAGSEILFTLFRSPGMTDHEAARDRRWVERDLKALKRVLERRTAGARTRAVPPAVKRKPRQRRQNRGSSRARSA